MRRAFFTLRIPNPIHWLSLRARWREIVIRAALRHITNVNARAKQSILDDEYVVPVDVYTGTPMQDHIAKRRAS